MSRLLLLAVLAVFSVAPAHAQWTTVHGFAPRATSRYPFHAEGDRVVFATPDSVFGSSDGGLSFVGRSYRVDLGLDLGGSEPVKGAGTWDGDVVVGSVCPQRCLTRSADGQTWTRVPIPATGMSTVYGLAMGVAGRGNVLVVVTQPVTGTTERSTVWRSVDGGATWGYAQTSTVLDKPIWMGVVGGRFFLIAGNESSYTGSLYSSADGDTWTSVSVPTTSGQFELQLTDAVVESGGSLFASASGIELATSTDGGATWAAVETALVNQRPFSLVGLGGGRLAGTVAAGHMRSADSGATWAGSCPLYGSGYTSDDFEASSRFLFTRAGGEVGRIDYAACGLTAPVVADGVPGASDALSLAFEPNPVRASARASFSLAVAGPVRLAVYDMLGREVAVLADGERPAGAQDLSFDTGGWAAGVYLVRLVTPDGSRTGQVTVAR